MLRRILNLAPESAGGAAVAQPPAAAVQPPSVAKPSAQPTPASPASPAPSFDEELASLSALEKPVKPAAAEPPKPVDKPPEPKPEPKAPPAGAESKAMRETREFGKRMEARAITAEAKIAEYDKKIADFERRGLDTAKLVERQADLEKQLAERDKLLYAQDVSKSPDFIQKYAQPLEEAINDAAEIVSRLEIVTQRDEDGNPIATRAANFNEDFMPIYNLAIQSVSKSNQLAKQTFGDDAQTVINHVSELFRLNRLKTKAFTDAQKNAETESQKRVKDTEAMKEWRRDAWSRVNTDISEKNPETFQPDPKDKQRAEIWNKSAKLVDSQYNPDGLTALQVVTLDATVRHRAIAYSVLKYDLNKANDEIADLKQQIAELKGTLPGTTQRPSSDANGKPPEKSFLQELSEIK
jgi:hypothetical protein